MMTTTTTTAKREKNAEDKSQVKDKTITPLHRMLAMRVFLFK